MMVVVDADAHPFIHTIRDRLPLCMGNASSATPEAMDFVNSTIKGTCWCGMLGRA